MSKKQKPKEIDQKKKRQQEVILGGALFLIGLLLLISFISYLLNWRADFSTLGSLTDRSVVSKNLLNKLGAYVSHFFMYKGVGLAAFLFCYLFGISGYKLFFRARSEGFLSIWSWGLAHLLWLSVSLGYFWVESPILSGIIGYEMNAFLTAYIGRIGLLGVLSFILLCFIVYWFDAFPTFEYFCLFSVSF